MSIVLDKESFKALANDTRVLILKKLKLRKWTATELAKSLGVSVQAAGKHLKKMRAAGLVKEEKRSKWVYYSPTEKGAALLEPEKGKSLWVLLGISLLCFAYAAQLFSAPSPTPLEYGAEKAVADGVLAAAQETRAVDAPALDYAAVAALFVGSICLGAVLYAVLRDKKCVS